MNGDNTKILLSCSTKYHSKNRRKINTKSQLVLSRLWFTCYLNIHPYQFKDDDFLNLRSLGKTILVRITLIIRIVYLMIFMVRVV